MSEPLSVPVDDFDALMAKIDALPGHGRGIKEMAERNPWGFGGRKGDRPMAGTTGDLRQWTPTAGENEAYRVRKAYGSQGERFAPVAQALVDNGGFPGAVASGFIEQPLRTGKSIEDAVKNPSLANVADAGMQSAMLAGAPLTAAGIAAAGYGTAGVLDIARSFASPAVAESARDSARAKLSSLKPDELKAIQKMVGADPDGRLGSDTVDRYVAYQIQQEQKAERERADSAARIEASGKADAAVAAAKIKAQGEADAALKAQEGRARQVSDAKTKLVADLNAARTPPKDESYIGQMYDKLGVMTPFVGGIAGGLAARSAMPYIGLSKEVTQSSPKWAKAGAKIHDNYLMPFIGGAEAGGSLAMAPLAGQANRSDPSNPEYRAWQNYRLALPEDATAEIGMAENRLMGPNAVPAIDPIVTDARNRLNDPWQRGMMMLQGGLGGLTGNLIGYGAQTLPDVAEAAATIPGRAVQGLKKGFGSSDAPSGGNAMFGGGGPVAPSPGGGPSPVGPTPTYGIANRIEDWWKGDPATRAARAQAEAIAKAEAEARLATAEGRAATERAARDKALSFEREYRSAADEARSAADEAARRSNAGTVGAGPAPQGLQTTTPGGQPPQPAPSSNQPTSIYPPASQGEHNALFSGGQLQLNVPGLTDLADAYKARNALMSQQPPAPPPAPPRRLPPPGGIAGREGQLDPYNSPIQGTQFSPADAARAVYDDAAAAGRPTTGRGGSLTKDAFPDRVNDRLRTMTGVDDVKGIGKEQLNKRRVAAEMLIDDIAKREGISFQEALRKYLSAEPTTDKAGMRRNLPTLSIGGGVAAGMALGPDSADADHHSYYQPRNNAGQFSGAPKGY